MSNERTVAVVTGANRGIGFEICRQLAWREIHVIVTSRDEARWPHRRLFPRQKADAVLDKDTPVVGDSVSRIEVNNESMDAHSRAGSVGGIEQA